MGFQIERRRARDVAAGRELGSLRERAENVIGPAELRRCAFVHRDLPADERISRSESSYWARASSVGDILTLRITGNLHAIMPKSTDAIPEMASVARKPAWFPSHPPHSAPGADGTKLSQRIVLVMRPSSGAGVTAWRRARKLMKMNSAPTPRRRSIVA